MIKCVFLEGMAKKEEIIRHVLGIYEAKYRCVVLKVGGVDQATANNFSNPGPHFIFGLVMVEQKGIYNPKKQSLDWKFFSIIDFRFQRF